MADFYNTLGTFLGLISDAASLTVEHLLAYKDFLLRWTRRFAWSVAIPVPVLVVSLALGWHTSWLYSAYSILVGVEAVILLVLAFPLLTTAQFVLAKLPQNLRSSVQTTAQQVAGAAFWCLMIAVYFYVFPVWENPKMIPLVMMCSAALALGAYAGWVHLPRESVRRWTGRFLTTILLVATLSFCFPARMRQLVGFIHNVDEGAFAPKQIRVSSPDQIVFVNAKGEPQLWYYRSPSGEYELYDHDGFHRSGSRLKLAETSDERNQITAWFTEQALKRPQEAVAPDHVKRGPGARSDRPPSGDGVPYVYPAKALLPHTADSTDDEPARRRLSLATDPGATYVGTVRTHRDTIRPIRLVFIAHNGSMIRAELSNPDDAREKRTLLGELRARPQPAQDGSAGYPIVLNPVTKGTKFIGINVDLIGGLYAADWGNGNALQLRLTHDGLEGCALEHRADLSSGPGLVLRLDRKAPSSTVGEAASKNAGQPSARELTQATAKGTSYIGTFTCDDSCLGKTPYVGRLRLVFTDQKDFVITAEATNPDDSREKVTFTGELRFRPQAEGPGSVSYPIAMSPIRGEQYTKRGLFGRGMWSNNIRLGLTDGGMEGEADSSGKSTTIRLVREGASPAERSDAEEGPLRRNLRQATVPGTSYIGTFTCDDSCLGKTPHVGRLRFVFTEQKDFVITAEATNPDDRGDKVVFAGELRFNPQPDGDTSVAYPIAMSPVRGEQYTKRGLFGRGMWSNNIRLRLTDGGMEGEADSSGKSTTISLIREAPTKHVAGQAPSPAPRLESPEVKALRQLHLGQQYIKHSSAVKGVEILKALIRDFPETQAAKDAQAELSKLE
jgi:hypothetical protein